MLNLNKIRAVHSRAEDAAKNPDYRERFDIATSRAVANLSTLVEYLLPFVRVNGICICMKGPNVDEELSRAKKAIEVLGGRIEQVDNLKLAADDAENDLERNIIIIRKVRKCSNKYPRKAGMPSKEPIN